MWRTWEWNVYIKNASQAAKIHCLCAWNEGINWRWGFGEATKKL